MSEKAKRNYPFRGKIYTAEQIDNIISGITFDGYTKEETDELLDLKQNILTAGDGISIVDDTISVTGGPTDTWVSGKWTTFTNLGTCVYDTTTQRYTLTFNYDIVIDDWDSTINLIGYIKKDVPYQATVGSVQSGGGLYITSGVAMYNGGDTNIYTASLYLRPLTSGTTNGCDPHIKTVILKDDSTRIGNDEFVNNHIVHVKNYVATP